MTQFDWSLYLVLADEMAGDKGAEARLRSAISRAYYAAFCTARNYLRDIKCDPKLRGHPSQNFNVHWYVINELQCNSDKKLVKAGQFLESIRRIRNKVDYDDLVPNLSKEVDFVLRRAKEVISIIDSLT